jgi:hypothetical protein
LRFFAVRSAFRKPVRQACKPETQLNKKANTGVFKASIRKDHQEVTLMKLSIVAVTTVFALSSPAFAQNGSSGGLNGGTLGLSQQGVNAGVPYPNPAAADPAPEATERTAPVEIDGGKVQPAATPKPHKKSSKKSGGVKKTAAAKDKIIPTNQPSPGASSPH